MNCYGALLRKLQYLNGLLISREVYRAPLDCAICSTVAVLGRKPVPGVAGIAAGSVAWASPSSLAGLAGGTQTSRAAVANRRRRTPHPLRHQDRLRRRPLIERDNAHYSRCDT